MELEFRRAPRVRREGEKRDALKITVTEQRSQRSSYLSYRKRKSGNVNKYADPLHEARRLFAFIAFPSETHA
jgi:hypothetical protein